MPEAYKKRLLWQHCVGKDKEHLKIVTALYVIFSINSTLV
jgi:hypothetical protein